MIGFSKLMGNGSEYWKIGFKYGGNGFYHLTPKILLGGCFVYCRFTPDRNEFTEDFGRIKGVESLDVYGSASITEVVPSLRIVTPVTKPKNISLFGQLGIGIFFVNLEATAEAIYKGRTYKESIKLSENKIGFSLGGGILIGKTGCVCIEVGPLYNVILTEEETTSYFSVNVGVGYSL